MLAAALIAASSAIPRAGRAQDPNVPRNDGGGGPGGGEPGGNGPGGGGQGGSGGGDNLGMGPREGQGQRGPESDPEMRAKLDKMRDLEMKLREVAKKLHQGTEADRAAAKTEVRKALGDLYDAKLVLETAMLERLEKHVVELKAKIARKKNSRDKAIESRLARMNGEGDDWD
jgi:hypothetical protein